LGFKITLYSIQFSSGWSSNDADIKYFVKNETLQNFLGYMTMIEPIKIMVSKKDAEEAIEILKNLR